MTFFYNDVMAEIMEGDVTTEIFFTGQQMNEQDAVGEDTEESAKKHEKLLVSREIPDNNKE